MLPRREAEEGERAVERPCAVSQGAQDDAHSARDHVEGQVYHLPGDASQVT